MHICRGLLLAGLVAVSGFAVPQSWKNKAARYDLGQSDRTPRFSDRDAVYVWHEGKTFFVAVGDQSKGRVFVRCDVLKGSIDNLSHRTYKEWGRTNAPRKYEPKHWNNGTDNQGITRVSNDVIEYETRSGAWDFVRFDVRRGQEIRLDFDYDRNGYHRTIYVGGEQNRRTGYDAVVIDFKR